MNEAAFESIICQRLEASGWHQAPAVIPTHCIDGTGLLSYLRTNENWQQLAAGIGEEVALSQTIASLDKQYAASSLQFFKHGVTVEPEGVLIDMLNPEDWGKNQFSYIRQVRHSTTNPDLRGDVALWVNGLPLGFVEVKNGQTGQTAENAVAQIVDRVKRAEAPKLFQRIIFSLALDTQSAWLSVEHDATKKFKPFNPCRESYKAPSSEFRTGYLYSGEDSFLHPRNVTQLLSHFVYVDTKRKELIFPRYHQWEAARLLRALCTHAYENDGKLGERFLFQHSPGSGKSKTIAWGARFLATLKLKGKQESLFTKIVIVTDRRNLDFQLQRDLEPTLGVGQVMQAQSTKHLAELLSTKCSVPVITTTVQKFLELGDLKFSTGERVCIVIDEAHRSQEGALHEKMRGTLVAEFKDSPYDETEFPLFALEKMTEEKTNTVTIAFTATPSKATLQQYGIAGKPHHLYSMRQAIDEGYILNPLKNVITYDTLYQLHQKGMWHLTLKEFPAALLSQQLNRAAYENPEIILAKSNIISAIVRERTAHAIGGRGKAMLVCSSKAAALQYQKVLRVLLCDYDIKPLIAFTGTVSDNGTEKTELQLNTDAGATQGIENTFENELAYRILVVVNKFQTGFDEPLLHTLFIDKTLSGINAVQTICRVNRCMDGKEDTLVVDFTNSFEEIGKAFKMFIDLPPTFTQKIVTPDDLERKFQEVLAESETQAQEWELDSNPDTEEGRVELDNLCSGLANKIKDAGLSAVSGKIQGLINDLLYLANKGLLTRFKEWQWRKLILKGVHGYLLGIQGVKPSVEEIRESVATVGMAVSLEKVNDGEIKLPTGHEAKGNTGAVPKGLTLAAAIHAINQKNFAKLTTQLHAISQKKQDLLAGEKATVLEQLEQFCEAKRESLQDFAFCDTTNPESAAEQLFQGATLLRENLDTPRSSGEIIKAWLVLEIRELRFRKLESAFYACHATFRAAGESAMLEATRIEKKLGKLSPQA